MIQLSFHGAAGMVTGSKYLLRTNDASLLIDSGMFQGPGRIRQFNWDPLPFDAGTVSAVALTHTHIDHIGSLPRLVKEGFSGPAYCTVPTADLASISLLDAAHLQEEDAEYRNRKKLTHHEVALPLFTSDDAEQAINQMNPTPFDSWVSVGDHLKFRFHRAGHILGAAGVEVAVSESGRDVTIMFSGDVGRYGNPLVVDPESPPPCDYLVCESTYGGRLHGDEDPKAVLTELINDAIARKSVLLIPAFAVSRTQQITYLINGLIREKRIPPIDVHIDSPMAISVTDVYCKHHAYHEIDIKQIGGAGCILEGKNVYLHRKRKSSKLLNKLKGPAIIMSASGMLTGGRILHHLINRLPDPSTTVALAGYMAEGTLGRRLADGETEVRIHKQVIPVKAKVVSMHGLSGHADYLELMRWLEPLKDAPRKVFVTHGELSQSEAMAQRLITEKKWPCHIPEMHEVAEL
ncbi:MAG: MBL fold metallo-hydrolase [candidate division Zixibacteria bacterium]|nr:MBL fold metallo-hydrolase [candidate division Zixibacteria bacterium]